MSSARNPDGIFINTELFRTEAKYFLQHGRYPGGEPSEDPYSEYYQYWEEQERRRREGYSVGGAYITGDHYDYLNFGQIKLTADDNEVEKVTKQLTKSKRKSGKKIVTFPDFWDGDYDYFWTLEIARNGVTPDFYKSLRLGINIHPEDIYGGKHATVGKARRKGYSYKNGKIVSNRYKVEPDSISLVCAYDKKYLYPEGTMAMANSYVNFYNLNTAWKRRKLIDRQDHIKDGYTEKINGIDIDKGYLSQIIALSAGDNPDVARGKDGTLILAEEAGKWPSLQAFLDSTIPTLEDGIYTTGLLVVFGTGGGDNTNWEDFETCFYEPEKNNMIRIENIWDDNARGTYCGFFHPDFMNKKGFIDIIGNSHKLAAKHYEDEKRKKLSAEVKDQNSLISYIMERANKPSEAFSRSSSNIFPTEELRSHRTQVEVHKRWKQGVPGKLEETSKGVKFEPDLTLTPVLRYKESNSKLDTVDISGCIVQYYPPYKVNGKVPENLYYICHDPYDFDTVSSSSSIASSFVMMNFNNVVPGFIGDLIVASYHGRPDTGDIYNENLFKLARYYGAKIGAENDRGDLMGYVKRFPYLAEFLEEEFELGWVENNKLNNKLGRKFGMSMSGGKDDLKRKQGDIFIRDWLNTVRTKKSDGTLIKNLHTINDLGFLDELIKYNPDKNFDRVSAFRVGMYYKRELLYKQVEPRTNEDDSVVRFLTSRKCG